MCYIITYNMARIQWNCRNCLKCLRMFHRPLYDFLHISLRFLQISQLFCKVNIPSHICKQYFSQCVYLCLPKSVSFAWKEHFFLACIIVLSWSPGLGPTQTRALRIKIYLCYSNTRKWFLCVMSLVLLLVVIGTFCWINKVYPETSRGLSTL